MIDSLVQIRPGVPKDELVIRACVVDADGPYLDRMDALPAPMLDDYGALILRGAEGGDLVGLIVAWHEDDHLFIDNIAIVPHAQGRGIGGLLLDLANGLARRAGHSEIRLYTNEVMTENLDYYPRRGFVETHCLVDSGYRRVYFTRQVSSPGWLRVRD